MIHQYRFSWVGSFEDWLFNRFLNSISNRLWKIISERWSNLTVRQRKQYFETAGICSYPLLALLGGVCLVIYNFPWIASAQDQNIFKLLIFTPTAISSFLYLGVPGILWVRLSDRIFGKAEPRSVWDMERYALGQKRNYSKVPMLSER